MGAYTNLSFQLLGFLAYYLISSLHFEEKSKS